MANKEKSFYQRLTEQFPSLGIVDRTWRGTSGLYCIHNLNTDRFYVGSAKDIYSRMAVHICQLRGQCHHCAFLQRDYNLGRNNLEFHVLKAVPKDQLIREEQILLDTVYGKEGCYNLNPIANSFAGRKHSDETKQRLSKLAQGRKHSQETKEKMRASHIGIPLPENHPIRLGQTLEAKEKIRVAVSGEGNPFFGRTHSDETKEKIATQLRGKYYGPTTQVVATDKSTGEERIFKSMSAASKNLGIAQSYISLRCAGLCRDTKSWSFKKVEA